MNAKTSNRFQWKLYDGGERRWSDEHTAEGKCPGCCCGAPNACPDCGGRLHQEPVEGMTDEGWEFVHSYFCERERDDMTGEAAEVREAEQ